jgi:ATP-dependent exoDNAse (exonuclease V) beta subunit
VLGLVEHLGSLADEVDQDSDRQAMPTSDDAVTVSTWFRSKGLEWPVVILSELNFGRERSVFDVTTVAASAFRFEAPLDGRWVRYWPWPYASNSKDVELADRAANSDEGQDAAARALREKLRLLYVAFTRPRDLLGLIVEVGKDGPKTSMLDPLQDEEGAPRVVFPFEAAAGNAHVTVADRAWPCAVAEVSALPPAEPVRAQGPVPWYAAGPRVAAPREVVNPSAEPLDLPVRVKSVAPLAGRVALNTHSDMQAVGDAIHGFLAADPGQDVGRRREIAKRLVEGYDVAVALAPETLLGAADALRAWAEARWPGATWHREWPLRARLAGPPPRLLVGEADLVLELANGFVLVDHKSFPGSAAERDRRLAEEYGPQLGWYARALQDALKKPLVGAFIHFPVRGEMAELELDV